MTRDQKSIITRAKRDGLLPMELSEELMAHDLLELMLDQMKKHAVAFKNMSEIQQDAAIAEMQDGLKDAIKTAVSIIGAQATKTVRLSLRGCAVGKKLKVTGEVAATEEWKHELLDAATDQADVLVILNERDFLQGLDAIKGEKQQKSFPLPDADEGEKEPTKPAGKAPAKSIKGGAVNAAGVAAAIAIDPALLEKAEKFITESRIPTVAGVQNLLSVGVSKAEAVMSALVAKGVIIRNGDAYLMTPETPATDAENAPVEIPSNVTPIKPLTAAQQKKADAAAKKAAETGEAPKGAPNTGKGADWDAELTDDLYEQIKAFVIKKQAVSVGAISVHFDIGANVADRAVERLELEAVISEEDEMGGRVVFDQ